MLPISTLRYASQRQLSQLTGFYAPQINRWLSEGCSISHLSKKRWREQLNLSAEELEKLLHLLRTEVQIRRQYQEEVAQVIEGTEKLRAEHLLYARPEQMAKLCNSSSSQQFTNWFNQRRLPGRMSLKLLSQDLGLPSEEIKRAIIKRQEHHCRMRRCQKIIDEYLSNKSKKHNSNSRTNMLACG